MDRIPILVVAPAAELLAVTSCLYSDQGSQQKDPSRISTAFTRRVRFQYPVSTVSRPRYNDDHGKRTMTVLLFCRHHGSDKNSSAAAGAVSCLVSSHRPRVIGVSRTRPESQLYKYTKSAGIEAIQQDCFRLQHNEEYIWRTKGERLEPAGH